MDERHTFTECLYSIYLCKRALFLDMLGQKSKLLYELIPSFEEQYMETFGEAERGVIEAELNAQLMKELYEKIRSLINRREEIDPEALKEDFLKKREEKLKEINATNTVDKEHVELSEVDKAKLNNIYKFMTNALHPALNPNQTDEEKDLYDKVVEAYKNKDLESLQTLRDVFFKGDDMATYIRNTMLEGYTISLDVPISTGDESEIREIHKRKKTGVDFSLAAEIHDAFEMNLKDHEYLDLINELSYHAEKEAAELNRMRNSFPLTAMDMLSSKSKIEKYAEDLKFRLKVANDDCQYYQKKINQAIGGDMNA